MIDGVDLVSSLALPFRPTSKVTLVYFSAYIIIAQLSSGHTARPG